MRDRKNLISGSEVEMVVGAVTASHSIMPARTPTYKVTAQFQAKNGRRSWKTVGKGLSLEAAIDKKTSLIERVTWCISAECVPEGGAA